MLAGYMNLVLADGAHPQTEEAGVAVCKLGPKRTVVKEVVVQDFAELLVPFATLTAPHHEHVLNTVVIEAFLEYAPTHHTGYPEDDYAHGRTGLDCCAGRRTELDLQRDCRIAVSPSASSPW